MTDRPERLKWTDDLSVFDSQIDAEHREFISHVDELIVAISDYAPMKSIGLIVEKINRTAISHFEHEEELMLQVGYPGLSRHTSKHRELLIEFEHLEQRFSDIEADPFLIEMGLRIKELLIDHLQKEDMEFRDYMYTHTNDRIC